LCKLLGRNASLFAVTSVHSAKYRAFLTRLREARERAGLTQAEVARALGKPQSYVSKCESGERRIDAIELQEFAELYSRPLSVFLPSRGGGGH
jgi:transcriptional regulator with XRE-family HTH domain